MRERAANASATQARPVAARSSQRLSQAARAGQRPSQGGRGGSGARRRRLINYPRAGKGPILRWLPGWRFYATIILLLIAAAALTFIVAYNTIRVPAPSEFAQAQSTTVYYADGTTKMGTFAQVNRTIIDASTLPDYVGKAVVASEDRSFYSNNGVDPKGIARAFVNNMSGGARQGASTLTQQYIKNYYVDTTSSYVGKFKQAIMAIKIDRELSKDEILASYLNTVYFGRGAYGIQAAAQAYFGHDATDLTVSESALLAGIMPAPSAWDPAVDPDRAKVRFERVVHFMRQDGYITAAQASEAAMPETIAPHSDEVYAGPTGHLLQMVRSEVEAQAHITPEQLDTGGYRIVTTVDKTRQEEAVQAAQSLPEGADENLHVALVALDPSNGAVVALYGGPDYLKSQLNTATDAVAQAGSTFKPFALVGALENGDTLANGYSAASPMTIENQEFRNFGNVSYGWVNLIKATANSLNTPYVQLNRDLGPKVTNKVAVRAGYPDTTLGMDETVQSVLGSASPHTIDIATAYATFAAQGVRHTTHIVSQVTTASGDAAYTANTSGTEVFSKDVMADTTYALQQVVQSGSGTTARAIGRPVAAKTGSSSENKSAQFVGYTPQLVTAVTLYQSAPDGSEASITPWGKYNEITGGTYPADIFTAFMTKALQGTEVVAFPERTKASYKRGGLYGTPAPVEPAGSGAWSDGTTSEEDSQEEGTSQPETAGQGRSGGAGSSGQGQGGSQGQGSSGQGQGSSGQGQGGSQGQGSTGQGQGSTGQGQGGSQGQGSSGQGGQ